MRVTFFHRRPQGTNFSIERLFADVRKALPEDIEAEVAVSRFQSRGFCPRLYNVFEAAFRNGFVNHITGDVHFLALLLPRRKTLLTIHDLSVVHRLSGLRRMVYLFFWYWLPIRRCALVSVISMSTKEDLIRHTKIDACKIRIVYNCVSSDFQPCPKQFNIARPVILQVGTGQNKNLERLVQALAGIPCHLRIIGLPNAGQEKILREFDVEYSFVANIPDENVIDEYRHCDLLAFVSTYEGFGLPIIEAQAVGRPVITGNILSMPEVAGDAACLVDPFDAASIRAGILKVINDSWYRDELARRGFSNVARFRSEIIAAQYAEIYRELAAR